MPKCKLTIYATTEALQAAEAEARSVLNSLRFDDFELETVDVSKDELRAQREKVTETPLIVITDHRGSTRSFRSLRTADDYQLKYALGLNRLW